ncbi:MAG: hypothetical protein HY652_07770 [Acidobacteria bacterium]|nr:hypothetical protein [Acidobacteriota bacterium]
MELGRVQNGTVLGVEGTRLPEFHVQLLGGSERCVVVPEGVDSVTESKVEELRARLVGQSIQFKASAEIGRGLYAAEVWYFKPVEEEGEVEYVSPVSLNRELREA